MGPLNSTPPQYSLDDLSALPTGITIKDLSSQQFHATRSDGKSPERRRVNDISSFRSFLILSMMRAAFPLVESKTLPEVLVDPEYREILEGLRAQMLRLLKDGVELKLVKKEEISY